MKQYYEKELFDRIDKYRKQVLDVLRENGNYHYSDEINLKVNEFSINYYRWKHPFQGSWEVKELFDPIKLNYTKKLIKPNSVVLDIGAHTGNMSVAYSLFANKVISFEPNPATAFGKQEKPTLHRWCWQRKPISFPQAIQITPHLAK